jgi:membrane-associated protease RseP (regulator of RpoE activity)
VPLLPFDGGHIAVATYERIRSRKGVRYTADYAKLIPVTYVVVALIVSVGLGAIYLDAVNPVQVPN